MLQQQSPSTRQTARYSSIEIAHYYFFIYKVSLQDSSVLNSQIIIKHLLLKPCITSSDIQFKMRISIFAGLLSLLVIAQALKVGHLQADREDLIVGGYSPLSTDNLPGDAKEIDEYIRKLHTDLKGAKLISASKQVVAGFNYHYIYRSADGKKEWDIVVYKNLKGKLFENGFSFTETLPNGEKVTAIADPASAFTGANNQNSIRVTASAPAPSLSSEQTVQNKLSSQNSNQQNDASAVIAYRDIFPNAVSAKLVQ